MPTPDGTRRLIRVVFEKDATQLPVVAELGYREDGSFAGAVTSFDAFGDYDDWQFDAEIEKDDLGRLILDRDANRWGNQTYTYRYAEDGQSYTLGRDWGTGSREQEIRLADLQIPELVKKPLGAFANGETREFNDEGLLTRCGINKRKEAVFKQLLFELHSASEEESLYIFDHDHASDKCPKIY